MLGRAGLTGWLWGAVGLRGNDKLKNIVKSQNSWVIFWNGYPEMYFGV